MAVEEVERFEDERYLLLKVILCGEVYVFLRDKKQNTEFLCLEEREIDLSAFWKKHKMDRNYCLPCELMLQFEKKAVKSSEHGIVDMGVEKERLEIIEKTYK